ncbi:DUF3327 domain-containing protein [Leucothrix sargassi]|nr:DUF3327 domain-containing protein [Leucothrix sargassi]
MLPFLSLFKTATLTTPTIVFRWLIVSLTCVACSVIYSADKAAQNLPMNINLSLKANEQHLINIDLLKGAYLNGYLQGNTSFKASIQSKQGLIYRHFILPGKSDARVFFVAPTSGQYQLNILANEQPLDVAISLKNMPLQAQYSDPKPPISSPAIQSAARDMKSGVSHTEIWNQLVKKGTPLVEATDTSKPNERLVTYLWKGAKRQVRILDPLGREHDEMYRLGTSDIWYRSYHLPTDVRLSYQIAPDVPQVDGSKREQRVAILATAQQDPTNPHTWSPDGLTDPYNTKSILELAKAPPALLPSVTSKPTNVQSFQLQDEKLGNTRTIDIWIPEALKEHTKSTVPLAIFFDGTEYQNRIPTPSIMNTLIQEGRIAPTVAVFVDNPDRAARARELPCRSDFADFMAQRLLPFISEKTSFKFTAETTLLAGASYGGLASACTAYRYPQHFGRVLSQSGSFWWSPNKDTSEWLTTQFAESPKLPVKFYLSAGRFEEASGESGILSANRRLEQMLRVKGYSVELEEFSAGHDYYHWRATLGSALEKMLSAK